MRGGIKPTAACAEPWADQIRALPIIRRHIAPVHHHVCSWLGLESVCLRNTNSGQGRQLKPPPSKPARIQSACDSQRSPLIEAPLGYIMAAATHYASMKKRGFVGRGGVPWMHPTCPPPQEERSREREQAERTHQRRDGRLRSCCCAFACDLRAESPEMRDARVAACVDGGGARLSLFGACTCPFGSRIRAYALRFRPLNVVGDRFDPRHDGSSYFVDVRSCHCACD